MEVERISSPQHPAVDAIVDLEAGQVVVLNNDVKVAMTGTEEKNHVVPLRAWILLACTSFGVFMASVSTTALIIAFPQLLADLDMSMATLMWVLLVVMLMIAAMVPTAGKLGDIFGQAMVFKAGYVIFVVGSLGAGFVRKEAQGKDLIACRVVIGIGAALLFTNSSAILTTTFARYNKVGLSQGVFQLSAAMGIVLGPLIGGALAESAWRWIFWFNVPPGGLFALLTMYAVPNDGPKNSKSHHFDIIGALFCAGGLVMILIVLIQAVSPDPVLSKTGPVVGLIVGGCVSFGIFMVDQFFAKDPLIPPSILQNRVFVLSTLGSTCMSFVRNSITYNMIFFFQGPLGLTPLEAGIDLIPYGIGLMVAGFSAGFLSDKLGARKIASVGPLITMTGVIALSRMDQYVTETTARGFLFLCGFGLGCFNSPVSAIGMLSVPAHMRGVASAVLMLFAMVISMIAIVITFSFVLKSMTEEQLFMLFIFGGQSGMAGDAATACVSALDKDFYILIACCGLASLLVWMLPLDLHERMQYRAPEPSTKDSSSLAAAGGVVVVVKTTSGEEGEEEEQDDFGVSSVKAEVEVEKSKEEEVGNYHSIKIPPSSSSTKKEEQQQQASWVAVAASDLATMSDIETGTREEVLLVVVEQQHNYNNSSSNTEEKHADSDDLVV